MKNWINKYFLFFFASLALMSCEKDEEMVFVNEQGTAPVLTASKSNVVLTENQATTEAIVLSWTASDFGYDAAVNYVLQIDIKGNAFKSPMEVAIGSALSKTFTVNELNTLLNKLPITAFKENQIEARVKATISPSIAPVFSAVKGFVAVPYLKEPPYKTVYMVGAAVDAGWNEKNPIAMLRDPNDLFKFTYTGKFRADHFKFLGQPGKWAPMWGAGPNNTLLFRETEGDADVPTIQIATEGYYTVTIDLRNNTYSVTPYDASSKPTYSSLGIIGTFTNWSTDVLMNKTAFNPHYWTVEYTFAEEANMKIRVAGDWGKNWGAQAGAEERLYNKAGGEDIKKIAPGTYLIIFNDLTENYLIIKK